MEKWKATHEFYEASDHGRVRSVDRYETMKNGRKRFRRGAILTPRVHSHGYHRISLGRNRDVYVHRLVGTLFIENPLSLKEINHIDGNKTNNHVSNLQWCTRSENVRHAERTGLSAEGHKRQGNSLRGEKSKSAKFNEKTARKIKELYRAGARPRDLVVMFSAPLSRIEDLIYGRTWTHI